MSVLDSPAPPRRRTVVRKTSSVPSGFRTSRGFSWRNRDNCIEIAHRLDVSTICDSAMISGLLPLIHEGVLTGQDDFEEAAVGVIRTSAGTEARGWAAFYDNSIAELRAGRSPFSPIHRRARSLISGTSVLEVGSCFGFLALQCADDGYRVHACDISPGAVALVRAHAQRRHAAVDARVGDATALAYDTSSVDTVTLIHLLEHLNEQAATTALSEALRVARQRVIVAVPYEEHPSEHFGHLVQLTEAHLRRWAELVEHAGAEIFQDHGGWLVLTPR